MRGGLELALGLVDLLETGVGIFEGFPHLGDGFLDRLFIVLGNFILVLLEHFIGAVCQTVGLVSGLDQLAVFLVLLGVHFGLVHHILDFIFPETARTGDGDRLLLAGAQVFR